MHYMMSRRKRPRWIVIEHWERYQHYKDRNPPWIKAYTDLLDNPAYLDLTPNRRALLHGLWLMYARSGRELAENTAMIGSRLGQKVTSRDLEALNHAGFIRFSASSRLAACKRPRARSRETEKREEPTAPPTSPISPPPVTEPPTANAAAPTPATVNISDQEPDVNDKAEAAEHAAQVLAHIAGISHLDRADDGLCDTPGCASDHRRWRLGTLNLCANCAASRIRVATA